MYGKTLINAQLCLLPAIQPGARILIAGGGTGWILEEITKRHPSGLSITYIDASIKMIALSKKCDTGNNRVTYITAAIEMAPLDAVYDIVLTPFLFDNFGDAGLHKLFAHIDKHIAADGLWLYSDFQNTKVLWQKAMLRAMYFFFRISCGIETDRLPDAAACFAAFGYERKEQHRYMDGFILSAIYGRTK